MVGWIILGIYVIGILLSAIIFPSAFPYQEGDFEIIDGESSLPMELMHITSIMSRILKPQIFNFRENVELKLIEK